MSVKGDFCNTELLTIVLIQVMSSWFMANDKSNRNAESSFSVAGVTFIEMRRGEMLPGVDIISVIARSESNVVLLLV